jgi:DtxR family transcriptional regulator, Mn-dependent transcriptional regulator
MDVADPQYDLEQDTIAPSGSQPGADDGILAATDRLAAASHQGHGRWSASIEDYLKRIYLLSPEGTPLAGHVLARALGVSHASVTGMLKRLAGLELVEYQPYSGVVLTAQGRAIALEVVRHHRLIEAYLTEVLGMPWEHVHEEAEVLEHHISARMEQLMAEQLGHPEFDPHGHPIPTVDGRMPEHPNGVRPLSGLAEGESAVVRAIGNDRRELLEYLSQIDVRIGRTILVTGRAPLDGPLTIQNEAGERHAVAHEVARGIDVDA